MYNFPKWRIVKYQMNVRGAHPHYQEKPFVAFSVDKVHCWDYWAKRAFCTHSSQSSKTSSSWAGAIAVVVDIGSTCRRCSQQRSRHQPWDSVAFLSPTTSCNWSYPGLQRVAFVGTMSDFFFFPHFRVITCSENAADLGPPFYMPYSIVMPGRRFQ